MSEFKGTLGPWESSEQRGVPGQCFVAQVFGGPDGDSIAEITPTDDPAIATANVHMIAAAPEMFEALQLAKSVMNESVGSMSLMGLSREVNVMLDAFKEIDAVIAKALGVDRA